MIIYVTKSHKRRDDGRNRLKAFMRAPYLKDMRANEYDSPEFAFWTSDNNSISIDPETEDFLYTIPEVENLCAEEYPVRLNLERKVVFSISDICKDWKKDDSTEKEIKARDEETLARIRELQMELDRLSEEIEPMHL